MTSQNFPGDKKMLQIYQAKTDEDIAIARTLLNKYAAWLDSLGLFFPEEYDAFKAQLKNLPKGFEPPDGILLLAKYDNIPAGCVMLRKLSDDICEMKRLFVTPEFRGLKIGKALAQIVIEQAKKIGYQKMRLDTGTFMEQAATLYKSMGFNEIPPYRYNPIEGTLYLELNLK